MLTEGTWGGSSGPGRARLVAKWHYGRWPAAACADLFEPLLFGQQSIPDLSRLRPLRAVGRGPPVTARRGVKKPPGPRRQSAAVGRIRVGRGEARRGAGAASRGTRWRAVGLTGPGTRGAARVQDSDPSTRRRAGVQASPRHGHARRLIGVWLFAGPALPAPGPRAARAGRVAAALVAPQRGSAAVARRAAAYPVCAALIPAGQGDWWGGVGEVAVRVLAPARLLGSRGGPAPSAGPSRAPAGAGKRAARRPHPACGEQSAQVLESAHCTQRPAVWEHDASMAAGARKRGAGRAAAGVRGRRLALPLGTLLRRGPARRPSPAAAPNGRPEVRLTQARALDGPPGAVWVAGGVRIPCEAWRADRRAGIAGGRALAGGSRRPLAVRDRRVVAAAGCCEGGVCGCGRGGRCGDLPWLR
jgi:hypothetical protein